MARGSRRPTHATGVAARAQVGCSSVRVRSVRAPSSLVDKADAGDASDVGAACTAEFLAMLALCLVVYVANFVPPARVKALVALASRAGEALGELVESGAAVDDHLLDQLIVFMALADGRGGKKSRVVARAPVSPHARTAMDVCREVVGARFEVLEGAAGGVKEGLVAVECVGIGATVR